VLAVLSGMTRVHPPGHEPLRQTPARPGAQPPLTPGGPTTHAAAVLCPHPSRSASSCCCHYHYLPMCRPRCCPITGSPGIPAQPTALALHTTLFPPLPPPHPPRAPLTCSGCRSPSQAGPGWRWSPGSRPPGGPGRHCPGLEGGGENREGSTGGRRLQ
jgi:hypothetical protein